MLSNYYICVMMFFNKINLGWKNDGLVHDREEIILGLSEQLQKDLEHG